MNIFVYFPKREELSFRTVFAFPNASRISEHLRIFSSSWFPARELGGVMFDKPKTEDFLRKSISVLRLRINCFVSKNFVMHLIASFADSVFPAPLSPLIIIVWFSFLRNKLSIVIRMFLNMCGCSRGL